MTAIKQWFIVFLSDGHGMRTAGKRTPFIEELGRFVHENEFNRAVVRFLKPLLLKAGIIVVEVAPTDEDTPLGTRVTLANRIYADYCTKYGKENVHAVYMSIHYNAMDGKFDGEGKDPEGQSVHISPGSSEGRKVAQAILAHLTQGTAQKNRGIVEQNLYETRVTDMPAVLSENGFMDNKREALLMLIPEFQQEVASEHHKGLCDYFGIPYAIPAPKPAPAPKPTPVADANEHVVKQGETLWGIAGKYGTTVSEIRKLNACVAKTDDISPGMVLKVRLPKPASEQPKPSSNVHIVKAGDTLWGIARSYGTSILELRKLNASIAKTDDIAPGDMIKLKEYEPKVVPKPAPAPKPAVPSYVGKRLEARKTVRFYNKPSWSDANVAGYLEANYGFTIVSRIMVQGRYQYQVKNSRGSIYYITTSDNYVYVE